MALYQTQRTLLKQRQLEKDDYISRLARDREDMQVTIRSNYTSIYITINVEFLEKQ